MFDEKKYPQSVKAHKFKSEIAVLIRYVNWLYQKHNIGLIHYNQTNVQKDVSYLAEEYAHKYYEIDYEELLEERRNIFGDMQDVEK